MTSHQKTKMPIATRLRREQAPFLTPVMPASVHLALTSISRSQAGALPNSQPPTPGLGPLSVMELIWASLLGMYGKRSHSPDKLRAAIVSAIGAKEVEYDKGLLIMRRTSLIFMGAIAGVGLALIATHPRILLGGSTATAASAAYQQLNLFGDVYERVRADYVEKPDDSEAR